MYRIRNIFVPLKLLDFYVPLDDGDTMTRPPVLRSIESTTSCHIEGTLTLSMDSCQHGFIVNTIILHSGK